jgi:hypothetical protein
MAKQFKTAAAFKASLEASLRKKATERGVPFSTLQLKFVIERLLARLFQEPDPGWLLKGGFAMDLRFRPRARTTKDVDLSVSLGVDDAALSLSTIRDRLQEKLDTDLGDYLSFRLATPKKELTNAPGGGGRFPCEAVLLGKIYAKFHIDVGLGDGVLGQPEILDGDDLLDFAGISPARAIAISQPQQFAEKVHAYTFPWGDRLNTRTKDLVDLVLLIERGRLEVDAVRQALLATFQRRGTHNLPTTLGPPPEEWKLEFAPMSEEAGLSTQEYLTAYSILSDFWEQNELGK